MKTYLQLVNSVLVEMREEEVASLTNNVYASLIGAFVNKAKEQVEDSYDWSALLTTIDITTVVGQEKYSLVGSDNRISIDSVVNVTKSGVLRETSRRWLTRELLLGNTSQQTPTRWANNGIDGTGQAMISLYPLPVAIETITFTVWQRTPDFTNIADETFMPHAPIRDLAIAFAVRERGEVGGQATPEYFSLAKRSLSDAIAYDSARNDDEDIWYEV